MLKFEVTESGSLAVGQVDVSPTVYLDHWALRELSEDASLSARLSRAIERRGGTLALSWVNLVEFTKVTNERQQRLAEALIESNLPRLFLLEVNPFVVVERENHLLAGGHRVPPHSDSEFLQEFMKLKPSGLALFTAERLFADIQGTDHIESAALANTFIEQVESMRNECEADSRRMDAVVRETSPIPGVQMGTRYILRELLRSHVIDQRRQVTHNDAIDFFHSVVPASYCDLILLDGHWAEQVRRARVHLANAKYEVPVARAFSKRRDGVERFFQALEGEDDSGQRIEQTRPSSPAS